MSVLEISDIKKRFGGNAALDGVSFDLVPRKINLLMGSNGSGKTTLINVISGLLGADGGRILFQGTDITNKSPDHVFSRGIIRTFQTPRLFPNLSVLENLMLADRKRNEAFRKVLFHGTWRRDESERTARAISILESLGLDRLRDNLAYDLSGGQIKLLELGKSLMSDSELVLLDEPIAGVNPTLAHRIFEQISRICSGSGTTFMIIEHRLDIALEYADHAFVMDKGRIIAHDRPDRILQNKDVIESYLGR